MEGRTLRLGISRFADTEGSVRLRVLGMELGCDKLGGPWRVRFTCRRQRKQLSLDGHEQGSLVHATRIRLALARPQLSRQVAAALVALASAAASAAEAAVACLRASRVIGTAPIAEEWYHSATELRRPM